MRDNVAAATTGWSFGYHKRPEPMVLTADFRRDFSDRSTFDSPACDRNANSVPMIAIPDKNEINRKRTGHISVFSIFHFHEQNQRIV